MSSGAGCAITFDVGFSPEAQHVKDLEGQFSEVGGSATFPVPLWIGGIFNSLNVGFTASQAVDEHGMPTGINLYTGSIGAGTGIKASFEGHGYTGKALVQEW